MVLTGIQEGISFVAKQVHGFFGSFITVHFLFGCLVNDKIVASNWRQRYGYQNNLQ